MSKSDRWQGFSTGWAEQLADRDRRIRELQRRCARQARLLEISAHFMVSFNKIFRDNQPHRQLTALVRRIDRELDRYRKQQRESAGKCGTAVSRGGRQASRRTTSREYEEKETGHA